MSVNGEDFLNSLKNAQLALSTMSVHEACEVFDVPNVEGRRLFDDTGIYTKMDHIAFLRHCELILEHNK